MVDLSTAYAPLPPLGAWLTILPVVVPLLMGGLLAAIRTRLGLHAPLAIATLCLLVGLDGLLLANVATGGPLTMVMGRWLPPFGIAFSVDLFGALLALTAAIVGLMVGLYALDEIDTNHTRYGFYPLLLFLVAGVTGALLTGDIFNLYVWFEVLLISSFGLLVLGGEPAQIDGAVKYGLLNLVGTTLFLIAIGYLYALFGTLNMADIAMRARTSAGMPLMTLATLFFAAFAMKAAVFPVNSWLPAAYHTPRMAVGALFAGLLTKVGVYAMLRVLVMLLPAAGIALQPTMAIAAGLTMLAGGIGAIGAIDLRRILGHWVIAGIGVMLAGVALGGAPALAAAMLYMLHSMVVMAGLYLLAGLVGPACGRFDLARLGGLWSQAPVLSALALVLLLSVSGLPPFSGFWPKAILVRMALAGGHGWLAAAILLSGFLITFAAGRILLLAFWRPVPVIAPETGQATLPRLPRRQIMVIGALSGLSLAAGLWPEPLAALATRAAMGLVEPSTYLHSVFPQARP